MAKGSHQTRGENDARVCCVCGERLVIRRQACVFTGLGIGFHAKTCGVEGWARYRELLRGRVVSG